MKDLKDAENILKNVSIGNTYFENLLLGADQDGLSLSYSFRLNSFHYHIKSKENGLYEYSTEMKKENEMQIDENIVAGHYSNKNGVLKKEGTLDDAITHVLKEYSKARLRSVKNFFEDEAETFENPKESLKNFMDVFKNNFNDFLTSSSDNSFVMKSEYVEAGMLTILGCTSITINDDKYQLENVSKFDAVELLFNKTISHYIDKKIENKMDLKNYNKNKEKSNNKINLH